ncbi:hypothetical protein BC793_13214 [Actinoplanes xinjiangensis]|uniref:Uncharacterized protein n=3 Tax=Actinoplanes xinjiangensis TaxID=512350 RepID=A0A316EJG9_9ACTN|nr:hypothetical protein BC793_13214 [Actinoplanes xinjiangensis]GIF43962.1 hypothetical protein Axi01nite_82730 [Actinoplanes xinjiangensis]
MLGAALAWFRGDCPGHDAAMAPTPNTPGSRPAAVPVGGQPARRKWLLPLLLALLALIAALLLSQCGDNEEPSKSSESVPSPTTTTPFTAASSTGAPTASSSAGGVAQADVGTVTAGGVNLLGAQSTANLTAQTGQQAVGRAVRVQSVPADEGFWVGTSEEDRLWVQLTGTGGESDYKVKQGDTIDFTGTVTTAAQDLADKVGLTTAEGAEQLASQGHYVSVPSSTVKLSS